MTGARIQELFKGFGKFIKLAHIGVADASGVRSHLLATSQQFGAQAGATYDDLTRVVVPLATSVNPAVASLDRVALLAKTATDNYLRTIGRELNQPATANTATILNALKSQMALAAQTITPSGTFWHYFNDKYQFNQFPTSGTPNISDGWVTTTIV